MAKMAVAYDCNKGCGFRTANGNTLLKHQSKCQYVEVVEPEFTVVSNIISFDFPMKKQEVPEFSMREVCDFSCQTEIVEEQECEPSTTSVIDMWRNQCVYDDYEGINMCQQGDGSSDSDTQYTFADVQTV